MIGRIIFGLVGIAIGFVLMIKARKLVETVTGPLGFAERYFGGGGTYNFYRFLGLVIMVVSTLIMFGIGQFIYDSIVQGLSGTLPTDK
jgi:hypothetical protein